MPILLCSLCVVLSSSCDVPHPFRSTLPHSQNNLFLSANLKISSYILKASDRDTLKCLNTLCSGVLVGVKNFLMKDMQKSQHIFPLSTFATLRGNGCNVQTFCSLLESRPIAMVLQGSKMETPTEIPSN